MNDNAETDKKVLVFGARSQIGFFLLPELTESGFEVTALTRRDATTSEPRLPLLNWLRYAPNQLSASFRKDDRFDVVIFLAPLPWLPPLLPELANLGANRLIAFGTTSRFYKTSSEDPEEQDYIREVINVDEALPQLCGDLGIRWTLFRPTLVYGCGLDRNITVIANVIRRFGFFPIFAGGKGLRQPVHAQDLARACVAVMNCTTAFNKAYNLSGGSVLTYREMVTRVFLQLRKPVRTLPIPLVLFRFAIFLAKFFPTFRTLSTEMATRQSVDMRFSHDEAKHDFGFSPRPFVLDTLSVSMSTDNSN